MSLDATRWAWSLTGIRPAWKLVLLSLADRAGEALTCWPSQERLAGDTGLDAKTVRQALKELCARGLISRRDRCGRGHVYTLDGLLERKSAAPSAGKDNPVPGNPTPGAPAPGALASGTPIPDNPASGASTPDAPGPDALPPGNPDPGAPGPAGEAGQPETADQIARKRRVRSAGNGGLNDQQSPTIPQKTAERSRGLAPDAQTPPRGGQAEASPSRAAGRSGKAAFAGEGGPARRGVFGEFGNVRLSPDELARLEADFGPERTRQAIALLDLHIGAKKGADPYKSHSLAMRKWVFDALREREVRLARLAGNAEAAPFAGGADAGGLARASESGTSANGNAASGPPGRRSGVRTFQQQAEDSVWDGFERLLALERETPRQPREPGQ